MHADHRDTSKVINMWYEFGVKLIISDFGFWSSFSSLAQGSSKIALEKNM